MARQQKKPRQKFTKEFKADAVELARNSDKSVAQIARDLGLAANSLRNWLKQAEIDAGRGPEGALTTEERAELAALRRENRQLTVERDFLKKASAYFAKDSSRTSR